MRERKRHIVYFSVSINRMWFPQTYCSKWGANKDISRPFVSRCQILDCAKEGHGLKFIYNSVNRMDSDISHVFTILLVLAMSRTWKTKWHVAYEATEQFSVFHLLRRGTNWDEAENSRAERVEIAVLPWSNSSDSNRFKIILKWVIMYNELHFAFLSWHFPKQSDFQLLY